jgi:hypothetical protein
LPDHLAVPTGRRGKKRKAGDTALDDKSSYSELRKAARKQLTTARSEAHRKKCIDAGTAVVKWLVQHDEKTNLKRVNRTTSSSSSSATPTLGSYNGWAFDFRKLGAITMDVLTFLQSRKRKLTSGDIVPDSVSNLTGYRTGIRYLFKEEQKWSPNVVRSDDVETWENMMADFFKSLDKGETKLKRDGKLTTKTGGDKFPLKILGDTTMKLWDLGNFMAGLQHLLLFNTCGRTGAVSHVNTRHIVAVEDHIASTFPFTKGDQTGEAEGYMLSLYSTPHEGEAMFDINLALGLHLLSSGGFPRGRLFGGQARPEELFRTTIKELWTPSELETQYGLGKGSFVVHSYRKTALTKALTGNPRPPSQMAMDLRAGHYPSDWKKTYYKADEVGDFHIGRQVGIGRVGHPDGTVLPAHFKDPAHPEVIAACKGCFPWWHEAYATAGFKKAAIRALAAVVHRREWIKEKDLCIVDTCPLFQDEARLNSLALKLGDIRGNGLERTGVDNADLVRASASISLSMYRMTSNDI